MSVSSISSSTVTTVGSSDSLSELSQDYESFLNLLVAQVENQDPLEPTDATQFVSQLATLTQVEQSVSLNSQIEALRTSLALSASMSEANLIGRTVTVPSDEITLASDGAVTSFAYEMEADAANVSALISDGDGNIVRVISGLSGTSGTLHEIVWDGYNASGEPVEAGTYTISLAAEDATGGYNTYVRDEVTSVSYVGGEQLLNLSSGVAANSGDIVKIE